MPYLGSTHDGGDKGKDHDKGTIRAVWQTVSYIVSFWYLKLFGWLRTKHPRTIWMEKMRTATTYEEWEQAGLHLDHLFGFDLWRENTTDGSFDWQLIKDRARFLAMVRADPSRHRELPNLIRSGLVRNLGNITSPKLYNCSFVGTKLIIEEYIAQVLCAIDDILNMHVMPTPLSAPDSQGPDLHRERPPVSGGEVSDSSDAVMRSGEARPRQMRTHEGAMSLQGMINFFHDTRQAFGRTCLVLQGGSVFGMCHLGLVRAMYLRKVLPNVITGTAVGALIAALVCIHTDAELPLALSSDGIDLSAFWKAENTGPAAAAAGEPKSSGAAKKQTLITYCSTLLRRLRRFLEKGYFLDMEVLEQCVRDNVGDLTFQEAFKRTGRVLNITVATSGGGGVPTVLNYITSPHVLIWTAAAASNADFPSLYGRETQLLCKGPDGRIERWGPANAINFHHWTKATYSDRNAPLKRVAELFNVNNYVISQARPYAVPFLQPDMHGPSYIGRGGHATSVVSFLLRITASEIRHRLRQLDSLGLLPTSIRRFLVDERIPGGGPAGLTIVPEVRAADFTRLLEVPSKDSLRYWILMGQRSTWPALAALEARQAIEMKLDWAYHSIKRVDPFRGQPPTGGGESADAVAPGSLSADGTNQNAASTFPRGEP